MSNEIEEIKKRLKAVEKALSELSTQYLSFLKTMAKESCTVHYNMFLIPQKSKDVAQYTELWSKRLDDAGQAIHDSKTTAGVIKIRDKFVNDIGDYVMAAKVDTADKAMDIAHSFIKKYVPVALPLKAERKDDEWLVDIDVGALAVKVAKVKVDAKTGDILSYEIPTKKAKKAK